MKLINGFHHTPGHHCGSTAMRDLLNYAGLDFSEAMCFGLGSGLGFYYFKGTPDQSPSHLFFGRTATLEHDLGMHLALDFEEGTDTDAERAWRTAQAWLDRDVPLLLHVELSQLPYYHTRTPFPGHRVVLAGYDDARGIAFLADTQFPGLQEVTYATLRAARTAQIPPIPLHNEWLAVISARASRPLANALVIALRENALAMTRSPTPQQGLRGMKTLAEDFKNWGDTPDWVRCAHVGYQNIQVRGTGGGFFRQMYAQFLREAETIDERWRAAQLAEKMEEIAGEWKRLGQLLQRIAMEQDRAVFADASRAMQHLAQREADFWEQVLDVVK